MGHAALAHRVRTRAGFVLGAMLPDFASMLRTRLDGRCAAKPDPDVVAGVAFHHRTDSAFHAHPAFEALCAEGRRALIAAGLRRGSALAAAHLGIELLLDDHFLSDDTTRAAYQAALHSAGPRALGPALPWRDPGDAGRFEGLRQRLLAVATSGSPSPVTPRIVGALRHRPRLSIDDRSVPILDAWTADARPAVQRAAPGIDRDLRSVLTGAG